MVASYLKILPSPKNQLVALLITSSLVIGLGWRARNMFRSLEQGPNIVVLNNNTNMERSAVKAGMQIVNFTEFNLMDNEFLVDIIAWFEFDSKNISLEKIGKFAFDKGTIQKRSEPIVKKVGNNTFAQYALRVKFSSNLSHRYFPFDDHRIFITLDNSALDSDAFYYKTAHDNFTLADNIKVRGWYIYDMHVQSGFAQRTLDAQEKHVTRTPRIIFTLDFDRSGIRNILLILLPLFLIFFIGLFAFSLDPKLADTMIMSLSSGGIASLIAYRFVINNMSPHTGYFLLSDYMFIVFLLFAFLSFALSVTLLNAQKSIASAQDVPEIQKRYDHLLAARGILFVLFHVGIIACWYYFLFLWT